MKVLALALGFAVLTLGSTLWVHADDNLLQNGDFADGATHWRGNGRTAADFASDNPFDKPDPLLAKGLIIPLRGVWDKIQQDFRGGHETSGVLTITYRVSADTVFSTKATDYQDVPYQLHYDGWQGFTIPPGTWIVFIADLGSAHGTYYEITPKLGTTDPQTIQLPVSRMTPMEDKTLTLGFPPGTGKLVIVGISLTHEAPAVNNGGSGN